MNMTALCHLEAMINESGLLQSRNINLQDLQSGKEYTPTLPITLVEYNAMLRPVHVAGDSDAAEQLHRVGDQVALLFDGEWRVFHGCGPVGTGAA